MDADPFVPPVIWIYSRTAAGLLNRKEVQADPARRALRLRHDVALRNVAGILRGSDPAVRDQFVIVSAHYDHLGIRPPGPGNRIFHGANDNASWRCVAGRDCESAHGATASTAQRAVSGAVRRGRRSARLWLLCAAPADSAFAHRGGYQSGAIGADGFERRSADWRVSALPAPRIPIFRK